MGIIWLTSTMMNPFQDSLARPNASSMSSNPRRSQRAVAIALDCNFLTMAVFYQGWRRIESSCRSYLAPPPTRQEFH